MVQNPGKTPRSDTVKSVNLPELVRVQESPDGIPVALKTTRRQSIVAVENRWRIDDEWWRSEPVSRLYYSVRLASGQQMVLYKNLADNCWYRQSY